MPHVLERILVSEPTLTVVALITPPVHPLLGEPLRTASAHAPAREALYVHTLKLTFTGRYGATLAYLKRLEHLPWRLYWDRLSLRMRRYPIARIRLTVHTLGLHRVLFSP
jgi:MSHA biogenesis protein MshJ